MMMMMMRRWLLRTRHPAKLRKVQKTTLNEPKTIGCSRPVTSWTKRESNSLTGNCSSLPKKSVRRLPPVRDLCASFVNFWKRWQELRAIHCRLKESQKLCAAVITQWRGCVSCVLQLSHSEETASAVCCSYHTVKGLCQLHAAVITQQQLSHNEEDCIGCVCCSYHTMKRLHWLCVLQLSHSEETASAACCSYHTVKRLRWLCMLQLSHGEETASAVCAAVITTVKGLHQLCVLQLSHSEETASAVCCSYHHSEGTASAVCCSITTVKGLHQLYPVCHRLKGLYELFAAIKDPKETASAVCCSYHTVKRLFHLPFYSLRPRPKCY